MILVVVDGEGGREYSWHTFSREVKEEQTTTAMGNWNQITGVITFNIPPVIPWNMLRRLIARPAYRERLSLVLHTTHNSTKLLGSDTFPGFGWQDTLKSISSVLPSALPGGRMQW